MKRFVVGLWRAMVLALVLSISSVAVSVVSGSATFANDGANLSFSPLMSSAHAAAKPAKAAAQLARANKLLKAGKAAKANTLLNKVIGGGKLTPVEMAKALFYRGMALRKNGKPAQAIADFSNAIWLKNGLPPAMRKDAEAHRAAAYKEAGLAGAGSTGSTARRTAVAPKAQARPVRNSKAAPAAGVWQTQTRQVRRPARTRTVQAPVVAKPEKKSGIGGFFSNLFSGNKTPAKTKTAAAPAAVPAAGRMTQVSGWSSKTAVTTRRAPPARKTNRAAKRVSLRPSIAARPKVRTGQAAAPVRKRATLAAAGAATAVRRPARSYRVILSPVRSAEVAQANARKVQQQFAGLLKQRRPVIESTTFGGGTFYQVRIGPFSDAAPPRDMCAKLKAGGVDCILAAR